MVLLKRVHQLLLNADYYLGATAAIWEQQRWVMLTGF